MCVVHDTVHSVQVVCRQPTPGQGGVRIVLLPDNAPMIDFLAEILDVASEIAILLQ